MIIYFLILTLSTTNLLSSMKSLPLDVVAKIASHPDTRAVYEIIENQNSINRYHDVYHNDSSVIKLKLTPLFEIRYALFPCFELTNTCKEYNRKDFKKSIVLNLSNALYQIFAEGTALFLLPKHIQLEVLKSSNATETRKLAGTLEALCDYQDKITTRNIFSNLFLSESMINSLVKTSEFDALIKALRLNYKHNEKLKQHAICDYFDNVVVLFTDQKHYLNSYLECTFMGSADPKEYKQIPQLLELLAMQTVDPGVNNIVYMINETENIASLTLIENILYQLSNQIVLTNNKLQENGAARPLSTQEIKTYFRNYFTVLNFLCSLPTIDLALPTLGSQESIAKHLLTMFGERSPDGVTAFSEDVAKKLNDINQANVTKSIYDRKEGAHIINALANYYVGYTPH